MNKILSHLVNVYQFRKCENSPFDSPVVPDEQIIIADSFTPSTRTGLGLNKQNILNI